MRLRSVVARLREDRGQALVMAIGITMVLALAGASLIAYSTSNERASYRSRASHDAYQLAVSGIENAVSQLASATPDALDDYTFFSAMSASSKTGTFDTGETVTWAGVLWDDNPTNTTNPGGSYQYTGSPNDYYIPNLRWRIASTSIVPNPNGAGTINRTVTADVRLRPTTQQTRDEASWEYIYSWKTGDPDGCDMELPNNPNVNSSFYVAGNLCLDNNSSIVGPLPGKPQVKVVIKGNAILLKNGNDLGTPARPLTSIHVDGTAAAPKGCKFFSNPYHKPCTAVDHVRPNSVSPGPTIPPPVAQFDDWYYVASPGPAYPCDPALSSGAYPDFSDPDGARNASKGTLSLASYGAFSCKTLQGELTWDPAANTVKVGGTLFWDGNLELDTANTQITYSGVAAIYLTGWFRMRQTKLCSVFQGGNCDADAWNTDANMFFVAVEGMNNWSQCTGCGALLESSAVFQGALYSDHSMGFQNNSFIQGPMVAKEELIQNSFTFSYIPPNVKVPFGAPGNTITTWELTPPTNFTG
ncbi:MAG: pilus assembly PilX N-terminal domain-containing protein [Thermoleophilia bacterium]|nr:pilus assembly PilX N-terminal domain-containing protein [Thermoleophilia bacterium]